MLYLQTLDPLFTCTICTICPPLKCVVIYSCRGIHIWSLLRGIISLRRMDLTRCGHEQKALYCQRCQRWLANEVGNTTVAAGGGESNGPAINERVFSFGAWSWRRSWPKLTMLSTFKMSFRWCCSQEATRSGCSSQECCWDQSAILAAVYPRTHCSRS